MKQKKHWKPDDPLHNLWLAHRGNKFSEEAWRLYLDWLTILTVMPQYGHFDEKEMKRFRTTKRKVLQHFNELARETASYVAGAILHKDASLLREIAELAENAEAQSDPVRVWLWHMHFGWRLDGGPLTPQPTYTIAELVNMATERRIWATPDKKPPDNAHRYMRELCDELGIKTKRDKRGRHKLPQPTRPS